MRGARKGRRSVFQGVLPREGRVGGRGQEGVCGEFWGNLNIFLGAEMPTKKFHHLELLGPLSCKTCHNCNYNYSAHFLSKLLNVLAMACQVSQDDQHQNE